MYICICNAVTDREIRGAVALGVRSLAELKSTLGVGTCCGKCQESAAHVVHEACRQTVEHGSEQQ